MLFVLNAVALGSDQQVLSRTLALILTHTCSNTHTHLLYYSRTPLLNSNAVSPSPAPGAEAAGSRRTWLGAAGAQSPTTAAAAGGAAAAAAATTAAAGGAAAAGGGGATRA